MSSRWTLPTSYFLESTEIKLELMKSRNNSLHLNVAAVERADLCIARHVQRSTYGSIYKKLSADVEFYHITVSKIKNGQLKRELEKLLALCPFFDLCGILNVCGRLSKFDINYDRQHQIILPKRHNFMNLVVQHYHEIAGHSGPEATLGTTHQKCWIVSGITTMKYYLKTCVICIKKHARKTLQFLGDLPLTRVAAWEPTYTHTGIDYYGSFLVTTLVREKYGG